ncbi:hypothetical protein [Streptomyces sp. NPDC001635]
MLIRQQSWRVMAVGAISAVCVGLAATTASATSPTPPGTQQPVAVQASITAKPSVSSAKAWELFRVTGKTTGLKAGTKVTLQQKQKGKWVTLPAAVPVARDGAYSLRVKLGLKGKNNLRITDGNTVSPVFNVTVR